jgi:hypothetical protein
MAAFDTWQPRTRHEYRNLVLSEHGPSTSSARLVAITLTQLMDSKTLESFAGAEKLASMAGVSERTVRTALKCLCAEGWIEERTKKRGRDFWLKIRRATFPAGLAASFAGSDEARHPAPVAASASGLPANDAGLAVTAAGLPANDSTTGGKTLQGHPATVAGDPVPEILNIDPEQDPDGAAAPSPHAADSAAPRMSELAVELERQRARRAAGLPAQRRGAAATNSGPTAVGATSHG